jgi:outer membrane immunogenic protein
LCAACGTASAASDWSGWYVGLNAGGEFGNTKWSDIVVPSLPGAGVPGVAVSRSGSGFSGGAQLGINDQMGSWVWGAELSFDAGGLDAIDPACFGGFGDVTAHCSTRHQWRGDLTGKLGFTLAPDFLLYAKGGGSLADERVKAVSLDRFGVPEGSYLPGDQTNFGWTVGGGGEVALDDYTSLAVEYDYADYGTGTVNMNPAAGASPIYALPFSVKVHDTSSQVTLILSCARATSGSASAHD